MHFVMQKDGTIISNNSIHPKSSMGVIRKDGTIVSNNPAPIKSASYLSLHINNAVRSALVIYNHCSFIRCFLLKSQNYKYGAEILSTQLHK